MGEGASVLREFPPCDPTSVLCWVGRGRSSSGRGVSSVLFAAFSCPQCRLTVELKEEAGPFLGSLCVAVGNGWAASALQALFDCWVGKAIAPAASGILSFPPARSRREKPFKTLLRDNQHDPPPGRGGGALGFLLRKSKPRVC